jgi:UDP-N-acetylmuramoyl-L-alanyl-D-glutamate--2,6-diaminopimelate ligase
MLPTDGVAIVNAMDAASARMLRDCKARVVRCGVVGEPGPGSDTLDASVRVINESLAGMTLQLRLPIGEVVARVPLIGRYNAMNVLQAFVAAHAMLTMTTPAGAPGLSPSEALGLLGAQLPGVEAPPGRLERVSTDADACSVFVDYAHSDDSLRNVLRSVGRLIPGRGHEAGRMTGAAGSTQEAPARPGRLIVVFGCGGDRDTTKRERMGAAAAQLADVIYVTSDNPRSERPSAIIDQILAGIPKDQREHVHVHPDRARAIRMAIEGAQPNDVIVIAGKGHETEQILSGGGGGLIRTHFDDREAARAILAERRPQTTKSTAKNADGVPLRRSAPGRSAGTSRSTRGGGGQK